MKTVTINPSIAALVNIDTIGKKEIVPIYFTAETSWVGTFVFKIFNSEKKNAEIATTVNPLVKLNAVLTLTINADAWSTAAGNYYYEITKTEDKRVIFKGTLNIIE